jgi:hypothetical protein
MPLVPYGCETWSLILREECRLRVFGNRVQRRIFGLKRNEVRGIWRKIHNEELHNLYTSPSIIRMIKSRAGMREKRTACRILIGKPEGKRPQGSPRHRWVDNIKIDLRDGMVWTGSIWLRIGTSGGLL